MSVCGLCAAHLVPGAPGSISRIRFDLHVGRCFRPRPECGGIPTWHFPSVPGCQWEKEWGRSHGPGAGDGNRTRVACLEGRSSTIELHRRMVPGADTARSRRVPVFPGCQEGNHAAGLMATPRGGTGRTRTGAHVALPIALPTELLSRAPGYTAGVGLVSFS